MLKYKFKMFFDYSKEEAWLNAMALQGWSLVGIDALGRYCFKQGDPYAWNYRIDYRTFKSMQGFNEYVQMFWDSGWQHVGGTKGSGAQYFVQLRPSIADDIFSDTASKAGRYRRQSRMWLTLAIIFLTLLISLTVSGSIDVRAMLNPSELYLTPGLWEKTGMEFWRAFLFETPFAAGRGFFWLLPLAVCVFYLFLAIRSLLAGRKLRY